MGNNNSTLPLNDSQPVPKKVDPMTEVLLKNIIDDAILSKKILLIKYWGGAQAENCGSVREVQPYGWKDRSKTVSLTFYGNCSRDNILKNYSLCLIENIYYQGECLISVNNVQFGNPVCTEALQDRAFDVPLFKDNFLMIKWKLKL